MRLVILLLIGAHFTQIYGYHYGKKDTLEVTVMTWNILGPIFVNETDFERTGEVNLNLLDSEVRLKLAVRHILETDADIVNLQELQENTYPTIQRLLSRRYEAVGFAPNEDNYGEDYLPEGREYVNNGVATFYKREMFLISSYKPFLTSDNGTVALLSILRPVFRSVSGSVQFGPPLVNINCHLEAGVTVPEGLLRITQGNVIAEVAQETLEKLNSRRNGHQAIVVLSGDMNTMLTFPAFENLRSQGYSDAMEILKNITPTFHLMEPLILPGLTQAVESVTLDYVFLKNSDLDAKRVRFLDVQVPDVNSPDLSEENHKNKLIEILIYKLHQDKIRNFRDVITYLMQSRLFSQLYGSRENSSDFDSEPNRSLRLGSDHLSVTARLEIKL